MGFTSQYWSVDGDMWNELVPLEGLIEGFLLVLWVKEIEQYATLRLGLVEQKLCWLWRHGLV